MKRAIVTPDKHFPFEDKAAIKVLCKAIELVKPDIYIDLGDTGEWESVSHWQWKKKKRPPLEYQLPFVYKEIADVMYGHHHDIQQSSITNMEGVKSAWSIGCLKDMRSDANKWLGNREHNWQHAFAIVDFHPNKNFNVTVHQIVKGVSTVDGKVLTPK